MAACLAAAYSMMQLAKYAHCGLALQLLCMSTMQILTLKRTALGARVTQAFACRGSSTTTRRRAALTWHTCWSLAGAMIDQPSTRPLVTGAWPSSNWWWGWHAR